MENNNYQFEAIKWLIDMDLLADPRVVHTIKANVLGGNPRVRELEYICTTEFDKQMLIWLDVSWWTNKFYRKGIILDVGEVLSNLLPEYKIRVVTDRKILEQAESLLTNYVGGRVAQTRGI